MDQILGAVTSLISALIGAFIGWKVAERTSRRQTRVSQIWSDFYSVDGIFIQYPDLRPYFFDGKEINPSDVKYQQLLAVSRLLVNSFAFKLHFLRDDPELNKERWIEDDIRTFYSNSPILRQFFRDHESEYATTGNIQKQLIIEAEESINLIPVQEGLDQAVSTNL